MNIAHEVILFVYFLSYTIETSYFLSIVAIHVQHDHQCMDKKSFIHSHLTASQTTLRKPHLLL